MAFNPKSVGYYGKGSWGLPELGVTEMFGGKKGSTTPKSPVVSSPNISTPTSKGTVLGTGTQYSSPTTTRSGGSTLSVKQPNLSINEDNDYNSELDKLFDSGKDYLNNLEKGVKNSEADLISSYTGQYNAQMPILGQTRDAGLKQIDQNVETTKQQEESALAKARRLYSELSQAGAARFGSGALSSAGQAATELLGRETSRNFGQIRQDTGNELSRLQLARENIQSEYTSKVERLNELKQSAISQARLALREQLDKINDQRFELEQNKRAARLDAIRENIRRAQAIEDQVRTMQLELMMNSQGTLAQINNAISQYGDYTGGQTAYDFSMQDPSVSTYGAEGGYSPDLLSMVQGNYTGRPEEELGL